MYISPERTPVVSSRIEKSFSPAVYIFHAIFQNLILLSLFLAVTAVFILLYTLERTTRIVGFPGSPRVTIRGHRRLQPASKSGSSPSLSLSRNLRHHLSPERNVRERWRYKWKKERERRAMKEEHRPKKRETGWCMCLDILDVRWIGARALALVTILMRLLYDVTFNGAPRPLPSGHNSPTGPSGFFRHNRRQTEKNRNDPETRIRLKTNTDFTRMIHLTSCRLTEI